MLNYLLGCLTGASVVLAVTSDARYRRLKAEKEAEDGERRRVDEESDALLRAAGFRSLNEGPPPDPAPRAPDRKYRTMRD